MGSKKEDLRGDKEGEPSGGPVRLSWAQRNNTTCRKTSSPILDTKMVTKKESPPEGCSLNPANKEGVRLPEGVRLSCGQKRLSGEPA